MRHLLVSYHTCPFEEPGTGLAGGMNIFLRGLLAGLSAGGIETDVLTRAVGDRLAVSRPRPGLRVLHLPCGWTDPPTRKSAWGCLPGFLEAARRAAGEAAGAYDVVSAHYWMSGAAAVRLIRRMDRRAPLLMVYHTVEAGKRILPAEERGELGPVRRRTEEDLAAAADRVVCFTAEDRKRTERIFPVLRGRVAVIPPGVDERFRTPPPRTESRRRLGIPDDAVLFLLAARADPGKGLSAAKEAVCSARSATKIDARLLVAGQAPPEGAPPDGVRYAGPVAHAEMPSLVAASDAVLAPSLYESFGFVPLEAMAAGTPVIVPDSGYWGTRIAAGGGGIAYPAGDPEGLRKAVLSILRNRSRRRGMAEQGRRIAAEFRWERCTEEWAALLSSVSRSGNRR